VTGGLRPAPASGSIEELIAFLCERPTASRQGLVELLRCDDRESKQLYAAADEARARVVGDEVHLRALIEFSNHCRRNCSYCGLRRGHRALERYRMTPEEIIACAVGAARLGYGTVVLQSGEDPWYTGALLAEIVRGIKRKTEIAVTLSIGERSEDEYRRLKEAGADRFLLRIETSSPTLYRKLHPDSEWSKRLECLKALRGLGYQVGSGVMIGLPGQTFEMLANDLLFLQSLELDMIGVGPFIPHPATPLAEATGGTLGLALRFVACLRLLCPEALIPATTALGALAVDGRQRALRAGANVLMPNCTPVPYRGRYELYPGKVGAAEATESRACV
jgi:biotin synthase